MLYVCVLRHLSHARLFAILWATARQASLSMGFSRQEYWSGLTCPPPGDLPDPGIEPPSPSVPALQTDSLLLSHQGNPQILLFYINYALVFIIILICKVAGFFKSRRYTFSGQAEPFPWASRFGAQLCYSLSYWDWVGPSTLHRSYSIFLSGSVFLACFHENQGQPPLSVATLQGTLISTQLGWPRALVVVNIQRKSPMNTANLWLVIQGFSPLLRHFPPRSWEVIVSEGDSLGVIKHVAVPV